MSTPTNPSDSFPVQLEEEVQFYDTDCGGVVHNLAYLRMVEKARATLFREVLQLAPAQMEADQVFPAVTRTEVDYLKPAKLGDRIRIHARFEKIDRLRLNCVFELTLADDSGGKPLVRCRQTSVLVEMPEGRPKRVPEKWRTTP
ncbi:MAG: acyl-CoA thioesterase [Verrucomicrobiales bacterium]|nr:acyl-CoA thioesterase [Verrucomicrobiales bacterium]